MTNIQKRAKALIGLVAAIFIAPFIIIFEKAIKSWIYYVDLLRFSFKGLIKNHIKVYWAVFVSGEVPPKRDWRKSMFSQNRKGVKNENTK